MALVGLKVFSGWYTSPVFQSPWSRIASLRASAMRAFALAAFARARGIPNWKLCNALRKQSGLKLHQRKPPAFVPVVLAPTALTPTAPIELVLAGGHRLLVPDTFDADALRRLMGVLSGC